MIKILVCCASGSGTSMLMKMTIEKACKSVGLEASVTHCPISEAKSSAKNYDCIVTTANFAKTFENIGTKLFTIKNPMGQNEVIEGLKATGFIQ